MPRNDRSCCDCQGSPTCCTACSRCTTIASYKDVNFEIDPAIMECSLYEENICDPNCIQDFSQLDPARIPRKLSGCQQQQFTTSVQYAPNASCCAYYEDAAGGCGCSEYDSDFYDSWLNNEICPDPIGSGVLKYTYRQVSGTARVHLRRPTSCIQDIDLTAVTSSAQYSTCVTGTDNYLRPSGTDQSCASTDPPTGCSGLSGSPTCELFDWDFPCWICPFCPGDWNGYPIVQGKVYATISGTLDVIRDYAWVTEPLNGSSSCWPALPASSTTQFQFASLMEGTPGTKTVTFKQAWSSLRAAPTHGGVLYGLGVEFDDFTI